MARVHHKKNASGSDLFRRKWRQSLDAHPFTFEPTRTKRMRYFQQRQVPNSQGVARWPSTFDDAFRCISEALTTIEKTGERWWEADLYRLAGELTLKSPRRTKVEAQAYFERALSVAREQHAKSWVAARGDEHGAAMARSREAARGPSTSRPSLRLVHRGL
jgi:hypothetical protein